MRVEWMGSGMLRTVTIVIGVQDPFEVSQSQFVLQVHVIMLNQEQWL